jgi:hypothetical protein
MADYPRITGTIRPTPRNRVSGFLADLLEMGAKGYDVGSTLQAGGPVTEGRLSTPVSDLLGIPELQRTLNRVSYNEPLTTGTGYTTRLRPDTLSAAMTVAPMVGPAAKAGAAGARMTGTALKDLATSDVAYNAMMNAMRRSGGMIEVLPQEDALMLAQRRAALPVEKGGLGLPADNTPMQRAKALKYVDEGFHETEGANIEKGLSSFDVNRVGAAATDEQTPYAMFIKPSPIGIGVARKNPAQMPVLVKSDLTDENILMAFQNREELQQYLNQFPGIKQSTQAVRDLDRQMAKRMNELTEKANQLDIEGKTEEADKIYKLMESDSAMMKEFDAKSNELAAKAKDQITRLFKSQGIGTVGLTEDRGAMGRKTITSMVLNPNENVRSRFAAFDPFRRSAAVATAMGVAAPDLMAKEAADKKKRK